MGSMSAMEYASAVRDGNTSLDTALIWHLRSNHYPPLPLFMLGPCKRAIKYANHGHWDARVRLPKGCSWRGQHTAPASQIIEAHHLESFLDPQEGES